MEYGIMISLVGIGLLLISVVNALQSDIKRMNATINKIAEKVGVSETKVNIDDELLSLIADGKKIKAIKRLRIVSDIGLKEAKEYIDNLKH